MEINANTVELGTKKDHLQMRFDVLDDQSTQMCYDGLTFSMSPNLASSPQGAVTEAHSTPLIDTPEHMTPAIAFWIVAADVQMDSIQRPSIANAPHKPQAAEHW